jgi:hypothetical protein
MLHTLAIRHNLLAPAKSPPEVSAASNGAYPAGIFAPLAPEASSSTVSFVEVSPSTEIRLKLTSTAAFSIPCNTAGSTSASVSM